MAETITPQGVEDTRPQQAEERRRIVEQEGDLSQIVKEPEMRRRIIAGFRVILANRPAQAPRERQD
jgi:hypothetical protein